MRGFLFCDKIEKVVGKYAGNHGFPLLNPVSCIRILIVEISSVKEKILKGGGYYDEL